MPRRDQKVGGSSIIHKLTTKKLVPFYIWPLTLDCHIWDTVIFFLTSFRMYAFSHAKTMPFWGPSIFPGCYQDLKDLCWLIFQGNVYSCFSKINDFFVQPLSSLLFLLQQNLQPATSSLLISPAKNASCLNFKSKEHLIFYIPGGSDGRVRLQCRRPRFDPWVGKFPWRRACQPTPVFSSGKSHGQRNYSPQGRMRLQSWM